MTTTTRRSAPTGDRSRSPVRLLARWGSRLPFPAGPALLGVVLVLGVLVRLHSPSELWLDESLSIEISRRPLPELFDALRQDGSPPLYYLLLHYWMAALGEGETATRALSTIFSVAALPVTWFAARRLGGTSTAWSATMLLAVTPFAVRYATETRMYALVQLLAALGLLCVLRALERPSMSRLLPVAVLSGALALTHYWSLFLLAAAGLLLLAMATRGPDRPAARRTLLALAAGGMLFLPWLPDFVFQVTRTGTPWAPVTSLNDLFLTVAAWAGGGGGTATILTLVMLSLTVLALAGHRVSTEGGGVRIGRPVHRRAAVLLAVTGGTLLLGIGAGIAVGAGFASRYSSVALVPGLLLATLGLQALPVRVRTGALVTIAITGLVGAMGMPFSDNRTQAGVTAARIAAALQPGDLVVYCPDQLGPAVSRRLPAATDQVAYPLLSPPELIDWVDYEERNNDADAPAVARQLDARTDGAVFVVWAPGYRTFGQQCEQLGDTLRQLRGERLTLTRRDPHYGERQQVDRYPGRPAAIAGTG